MYPRILLIDHSLNSMMKITGQIIIHMMAGGDMILCLNLIMRNQKSFMITF